MRMKDEMVPQENPSPVCARSFGRVTTMSFMNRCYQLGSGPALLKDARGIVAWEESHMGGLSNNCSRSNSVEGSRKRN